MPKSCRSRAGTNGSPQTHFPGRKDVSTRIVFTHLLATIHLHINPYGVHFNPTTSYVRNCLKYSLLSPKICSSVKLFPPYCSYGKDFTSRMLKKLDREQLLPQLLRKFVHHFITFSSATRFNDTFLQVK